MLVHYCIHSTLLVLLSGQKKSWDLNARRPNYYYFSYSLSSRFRNLMIYCRPFLWHTPCTFYYTTIENGYSAGDSFKIVNRIANRFQESFPCVVLQYPKTRYLKEAVFSIIQIYFITLKQK